MVSMCLPSDALLQHLPSYLGFSYLGVGYLFSLFKCSFDEFVGEKVVSPSYSSAILGPPPPRYRTLDPTSFIWVNLILKTLFLDYFLAFNVACKKSLLNTVFIPLHIFFSSLRVSRNKKNSLWNYDVWIIYHLFTIYHCIHWYSFSANLALALSF